MICDRRIEAIVKFKVSKIIALVYGLEEKALTKKLKKELKILCFSLEATRIELKLRCLVRVLEARLTWRKTTVKIDRCSEEGHADS